MLGEGNKKGARERYKRRNGGGSAQHTYAIVKYCPTEVLLIHLGGGGHAVRPTLVWGPVVMEFG